MQKGSNVEGKQRDAEEGQVSSILSWCHGNWVVFPHRLWDTHSDKRMRLYMLTCCKLGVMQTLWLYPTCHLLVKPEWPSEVLKPSRNSSGCISLEPWWPKDQGKTWSLYLCSQWVLWSPQLHLLAQVFPFPIYKLNSSCLDFPPCSWIDVHRVFFSVSHYFCLFSINRLFCFKLILTISPEAPFLSKLLLRATVSVRTKWKEMMNVLHQSRQKKW